MAGLRWPKSEVEFDVPVYGGRVYLYTDVRRLGRARRFLKLGEEERGLNGRCATVENEKTGEVLYLVSWYNGDVGTLAHEAGHLAFSVLERAGVLVGGEAGDEAYCYLLGDLVRRLSAGAG